MVMFVEKWVGRKNGFAQAVRRLPEAKQSKAEVEKEMKMNPVKCLLCGVHFHVPILTNQVALNLGLLRPVRLLVYKYVRFRKVFWNNSACMGMAGSRSRRDSSQAVCLRYFRMIVKICKDVAVEEWCSGAAILIFQAVLVGPDTFRIFSGHVMKMFLIVQLQDKTWRIPYSPKSTSAQEGRWSPEWTTRLCWAGPDVFGRSSHWSW